MGRITAYLNMYKLGECLRTSYTLFTPLDGLKESNDAGDSSIDCLAKQLIDEMDNKRMPFTRIAAPLLAMYNR